mmetsp:Transcript_66620/g.135645  ORF Transcript_66620/g.135645 Transcript_66620/m.135645 type:complete len:136 (+) Transcript_66620:3-410(+)
MDMRGTDMPVIVLNPKLMTNTFTGAGTLLKQYRKFEKTLLPVFHLEQIDPPEDDAVGLNSCVVSRVWPRPYSTWEDNPDDPEALDGYFLLDLNESQAPPVQDCLDFLRISREMSVQMAKRVKRASMTPERGNKKK